ncbi:related to adenylate kinase 2 [Ramularia collo-cygni]|uniref:GTP:AMP phosphotransferase, mitochondrial n=1 Tax=Ramularia collo-cygni TaxID=112498 RepID=A0A2D3V1M8_9PEZI|nr:related to adenylate kinase 2 [Ramularia collo-cygni]CZT19370.1 related to adenylate kinase 2 [Ramularia collo-cygni]
MAGASVTSQLRKAARIILIGAPGVGKGTQTERLLHRFPQLSSISSGDLLRDNVRNKTPLGNQAAELMNRGALVPDSMILRLIRNALTTRGWLIPADGMKPMTLNFASTQISSDATITESVQHNDYIHLPPDLDSEYRYSDHPDASFILDGFPRNAAQAAQLEKMIPVNLAIHVHTPTEVILGRIGNRWVHPKSGRVYNTTFNAPKEDGKDDITGEPLIQRDDDKPEVWRQRLKTFEESSKDLLGYYEKRGVLWKVEGGSSDEITPRLFDEFDKRFGA